MITTRPETLLPFWKRFLIYQKERFPFAGHGVLIGAFTFSAVSYSRICRGATGFIPLADFLAGIFLTITIFFLVRLFDEFKDQHDDAKFRKHLPVPRGLISLKELRLVGILTFALQVLILTLFLPGLAWLFFLTLIYLVLMGVEFFIPKWLKRHQMMYVASHMIIIPLVDLFASALDWGLESNAPHIGLVFFIVLSFFNGIVLEFGRKIKAPQDEEDGVLSYTKYFGTQRGIAAWFLVLSITFTAAQCAAHYAGYGLTGIILLSSFYIACTIPGVLFYLYKSTKYAKMIEWSSLLWTIFMYLSLGGIPMFLNLLTP